MNSYVGTTPTKLSTDEISDEKMMADLS